MTRAPSGVERTSRLPTTGAGGVDFTGALGCGRVRRSSLIAAVAVVVAEVSDFKRTSASVKSRGGPVVAAKFVGEPTETSDAATSPASGERPQVPTPKPAANPNAAPIKSAN